MTLTDQSATVAPSEPLEGLARFAFEAAPRLCDPAHGCAPYHRAWSMIRLLMKGGALPAGEEFFAPRLVAAARGGVCRVLLSGAADTGLAALVLRALGAAGVRPQIVLADRCATTLEQNRRFAAQIGARFEVHHGDLAGLDCAPVDAVVMHSILHFIPPEARASVVASWARVLRPGGELMGFQRLSGAARSRDPAGIATSAAGLEAAALAYGFDPAEAAQIRLAGAAFWAARLTHAPSDPEAFRGLLARAGFDLMEIVTPDAAQTGSPVHLAGQSGPGPQSLFAARRRGLDQPAPG